MFRTLLLRTYPLFSTQLPYSKIINKSELFMKRKYGHASLSFSTFNDRMNQNLETVEHKLLNKKIESDQLSRSSSLSSLLIDNKEDIYEDEQEIKKRNITMKSLHYELMMLLENAQCKSCKHVHPLPSFKRKNSIYNLNHCYICRYDKLMENPFQNVTSHMFSRTKDRCRKLKVKGRHLEFNITHDQIKQRILDQNEKCPLSGIPFTYLLGRHNKGPTGIAWNNPSIDRIDSNKGYIMDNIIITTVSVNMMKNELSMGQFIETCKLITNNHNI